MWLAASVPGGIGFALAFLMTAGGWAMLLSQNAYGAVSTLFSAGLLCLGWLLMVRGRDIGWKALGLRGFGLRHSILVPMLLAVDLMFTISYLALLDTVFPTTTDTSEAEASAASEEASESIPPPPRMEVVATVLAAPICEELFFRGILFTGFRRHYGPKRAAVFSALVFAVYHLDPIWFVGLFLSGVALAALLDATGSIWPSILVHAAWNGLMVLGGSGLVIGILLVSVAAVLLLPLWFGAVWLWKRLRRTPRVSC